MFRLFKSACSRGHVRIRALQSKFKKCCMASEKRKSMKMQFAVLPGCCSANWQVQLVPVVIGRARGVNMHAERGMGLVKQLYLPGGGGERGPSSLTAELADSACSFTPTPPFSACNGPESAGSGFFPSVSTGAFPSATASVQQTKR